MTLPNGDKIFVTPNICLKTHVRRREVKYSSCNGKWTCPKRFLAVSKWKDYQLRLLSLKPGSHLCQEMRRNPWFIHSHAWVAINTAQRRDNMAQWWCNKYLVKILLVHRFLLTSVCVSKSVSSSVENILQHKKILPVGAPPTFRTLAVKRFHVVIFAFSPVFLCFDKICAKVNKRLLLAVMIIIRRRRLLRRNEMAQQLKWQEGSHHNFGWETYFQSQSSWGSFTLVQEMKNQDRESFSSHKDNIFEILIQRFWSIWETTINRQLTTLPFYAGYFLIYVCSFIPNQLFVGRPLTLR